MAGLKIIVCGGRDYHDADHVEAFLDALDLERGPLTVITGGARGADYCAKAWAYRRGRPFLEVPARWDIHGKSAGPIRNRLMADEQKPDAVVKFPGGRGTTDMVNVAVERGLTVIRSFGRDGLE